MEHVVRWVRMSSVRVVVACVFVLVAGTMTFGIPGLSSVPPYRIDLDVYRIGGQVWLAGGDLYGVMPPTSSGFGLPFTYPPIAAVLFAPLAWVPLPVASVLVGLASVATLAGVVALVIRELTEVRGADLIWLTLAVTALTLPFGPVRETFAFGQINIFLMILVVVDVCLGRGRWWHGSLIGVAAAIKLTPAVFFLYLLLRKDVRGILVGGASFLLAHVFGFLLAWDDSIVYWTKALRDPSRIGGLAYASNQSVNGFLHRLGLDEGATQILWMVLVAVIVATTSILMVRLIRVGHDLAAVVVVAFAGLLASPVSWAHHWVWAVPAVLVLALWAIVERPRLGGRGSDALGVTALVGCAIFLSTPYWWFPNEQNRELDWSWYMHVVGNLYLWWALAFGAALWWGTTRLKRGGKTTATASPDSPPPIAA